MKRAFTPKVESVTSCPADNDALAKLSAGKLAGEIAGSQQPISPEVNRRTCTSAALIGLAISMGASSLLLPKPGDRVMAAEPVAAEPTGDSAVPSQFAVVSPSPQQAAEASPSGSTQVEQKQQPQSELNGWQMSPRQSEENVNSQSGANPENALDGIESQRNRSQKGLAEWGVEEKTNTSSAEVDQGRGVVNPSFEQPTVVESVRERNTPAVQQPGLGVSIPSPLQNPVPLSSTVGGVTPKTETVPSQVISPNLGIQPIPASARLQGEKPSQAESAAAVPTRVHQVKPGDTVNAIAQTYGVSPTKLLQSNDLGNSNQLLINQQLRIPASQSSASVPGFQSTVGNVAPKPEVAISKLSVPTFSTNVPDVAVNKPASGSQATALASTLLRTAVPNSTILVAAKPTETPQSQINTQESLYLDKLKGEISQLQQQYPGQGQSNLVAQAAPGSVRIPVPTPFNNNFRSINLQVPYRPQNQPAPVNSVAQPTSGSVEIVVPPPEANSVARPSASPRQGGQQPNVTATSPTGSSYNPMIEIPVGEPVSPELPPLPGPNPYIPDSPTQFTGYIWPAKGVLTSGYGRRWGRMHKGIDIGGPVGSPIYAAAPGVILSAGWNNGGYGNLVVIQHPDGSRTLYAHNSRLLVQAGQEVEQGQPVAALGNTGRSTGPHLHFEIHASGKGAVNPIALLPRRARNS